MHNLQISILSFSIVSPGCVEYEVVFENFDTEVVSSEVLECIGKWGFEETMLKFNCMISTFCARELLQLFFNMQEMSSKGSFTWLICSTDNSRNLSLQPKSVLG